MTLLVVGYYIIPIFKADKLSARGFVLKKGPALYARLVIC